MTFNPKISIVIPVYNGTNYMREAIDSALAQTYQNKEIIVINDGSRDNGATLEVAKRYGDKIKLIDKPNGGVASALNAGIDAASGEYISWLSHDDIYPADKLEKQVEFLSRLDNKDTILFGDFITINEKSEHMQMVSTATVDSSRMTFELYADQCIHGCTLLVPKRVFETVGNFRLDLPTTQDYDLWIRTSLKFPFMHIPGIYTYSRQHAEQGSRTLKHHQEVLNFYLNNLTQYLTPEWLDSRYSTEELEDKYLILLKKFSNGRLWPAFFQTFRQARKHLSFKKGRNTVCFTLKAIGALYAGSIKGVIKQLIPLPVKNFLRKNMSLSSIKNTIKRILPEPVLNLLRRNLNRPLNDNGKPNVLDFINIYKTNIFGSDESHSGTGSTMEETAYIRSIFPDLLREIEAKTLLDVPCGDFNWMRTVDLSGVHYIGGDIVPDLIQNNNEKYATDTIEFRMLNIITDDLPKVDVILCRDCLVHLNFESGLKAIQNFKRSGSKYLLATTFTDRKKNEELYGIWRTLNLQKTPYNLPQPVKIINEKCPQGNGAFADKSLGLWLLQDL